MAIAEVAPTPVDMVEGWRPPPVGTPGETGLTPGFLADLSLKIMYFRGQVSGTEIAHELKLPFETVVRPVMSFLRREQLCEIKGSTGLVASSFEYVITTKGSSRAREQLERIGYVGPAPVSWNQYIDAINAQGTRKLRVNPPNDSRGSFAPGA